MKINHELPNKEFEKHDYPISVVSSMSLFFSIGITISFFLTIYKLGLGDTPIVNWSWWIVVTPAFIFPIFMLIYFSVGLLVAIIFSPMSNISAYPIDDDED
jgi:hypothetical protein